MPIAAKPNPLLRPESLVNKGSLLLHFQSSQISSRRRVIFLPDLMRDTESIQARATHGY
jgi:hypothetical protein